jgi:hypothetical protein
LNLVAGSCTGENILPIATPSGRIADGLSSQQIVSTKYDQPLSEAFLWMDIANESGFRS